MANPEFQPLNETPLAHSIEEVRQKLRCGRTTVYELLGSGQLEAKKIGRRTIVTDEALRRYIASLPSWC